jgi:glutathione S-transferase
MSGIETITLFHAPQSRSAGVRILLEELGVPYQLTAINMKAEEQRQPAFLAINPLGKVPAIRHCDQVITEQVAIFIYLADLFPGAGLAPALHDRQRGSYLRWLVYYAACFEPGLVDKAMQREPAPLAMSPYGDFNAVLTTLENQIREGPYLLGEKFTAADVLWGNALCWTMAFNLVPQTEVFRSYADRVADRPAAALVGRQDADLAAEHEKLAAALATCRS